MNKNRDIHQELDEIKNKLEKYEKLYTRAKRKRIISRHNYVFGKEKIAICRKLVTEILKKGEVKEFEIDNNFDYSLENVQSKNSKEFSKVQFRLFINGIEESPEDNLLLRIDGVDQTDNQKKVCLHQKTEFDIAKYSILNLDNQDNIIEIWVLPWPKDISVKSTYSQLNHTHAYSTLTSIPGVFTPIAHTHDYSPTNHTHAYSTLTSIPGAFTPIAHTHDYSPTNHTHAYSTLTSIPGAFTPIAHIHEEYVLISKYNDEFPRVHINIADDKEINGRLKKIRLSSVKLNDRCSLAIRLHDDRTPPDSKSSYNLLMWYKEQVTQTRYNLDPVSDI